VLNIKDAKMKIIVGLLLFIVFDVLAQESADIPDLGTIQIREIDGMEMVYIPIGSFKMGSSNKQLDEAMQECRKMYGGDKYCQRRQYNHELPQHEVLVDAFWIDKTEVSNAQFCKFLNAKGNQSEAGIAWLEPGAGHRGVVYGYIDEINGMFTPKTGYENYPVIEVSWYGAAAYSKWVGGRLPTEAEWEYAARGPASSIYPWGNEFNGRNVNYRDSSFTFDNQGKDTAFNDGYTRWAPVGSFPNGASWCGALDMVGNVHEWVGDWWAQDYYAISPAKNPQGPNIGTLKIGRGGSWYDPNWHVRTAYRKGLSPSSVRMHWIGFRCVIPGK
jgi:formylglycine-generating enzyme required for sulfatase activity